MQRMVGAPEPDQLHRRRAGLWRSVAPRQLVGQTHCVRGALVSARTHRQRLWGGRFVARLHGDECLQ